MLSFLDRWSGINSFDAVVKTVVMEFHWSPNIIDEMYFDDLDHHGLMYWYNHLKESHKKIKSPE